MSVVVVTDSSAYLEPAAVERWGISVVPLQVIIGGREFDDGAQIDAEGVAAALREWTPVTTSRPAPQRFGDAYEGAAARGATGVVSVHLSGEMSGTYEAARLAAKEARIPVEVIDSRSIGMGLGFPVLAAARAAAQGASLDEVAAAARTCAEGTRIFFYVNTLEHLRRGGRIGPAATLLGSALAIKPLLHLADGSIALLEKVRTTARALSHLEDLATSAAGETLVNVAIQHLSNPTHATSLATRLSARIPNLNHLTITEAGAAIAAHTGPGMLSVTISPATSEPT
ncbi:DegV domain-containing protein [Acrocarpospora phusangensis]|uniref:DegV domain-containing protein n=1 Tax=Acrocarpospora phusangensis TaxID=1070424 RepID=A0A919QF28_9ACTN|nr:DegV family protein [Acrocarpospora phusangensis]GIH26619.1 DegV domain-containing protein [Acrocarpospora phusangensis]